MRLRPPFLLNDRSDAFGDLGLDFFEFRNVIGVSVARNREKSLADGADETSLLVNDVDRLPRESEAARQLGLRVSGGRSPPVRPSRNGFGADCRRLLAEPDESV